LQGFFFSIQRPKPRAMQSGSKVASAALKPRYKPSTRINPHQAPMEHVRAAFCHQADGPHPSRLPFVYSLAGGSRLTARTCEACGLPTAISTKPNWPPHWRSSIFALMQGSREEAFDPPTLLACRASATQHASVCLRRPSTHGA